MPVPFRRSIRMAGLQSCLLAMLAVLLPASPAVACEEEIEEPLRIAEVILILSLMQDRRPECVLESAEAEPWIFVLQGQTVRFERVEQPKPDSARIVAPLVIPYYPVVSEGFKITSDGFPERILREALDEAEYEIQIDQENRVAWIIDVEARDRALEQELDLDIPITTQANTIGELYEELTISHAADPFYRTRWDDSEELVRETIGAREDPLRKKPETLREGLGALLRGVRSDLQRWQSRDVEWERHFSVHYFRQVREGRMGNELMFSTVNPLIVDFIKWDERIRPLEEPPTE